MSAHSEPEKSEDCPWDTVVGPCAIGSGFLGEKPSPLQRAWTPGGSGGGLAGVAQQDLDRPRILTSGKGRRIDPITRQWSEMATGGAAQPGRPESWGAGAGTDQLVPAGREHTGVDVETLMDTVSRKPENHAWDTGRSHGRPGPCHC